jgi:hypothetical protein
MLAALAVLALLASEITADSPLRRPVGDSNCPTVLYPCNVQTPCTQWSYEHIYAQCSIPPFPSTWIPSQILSGIANTTTNGPSVSVKAQTADQATATVEVSFAAWAGVYNGSVAPNQPFQLTKTLIPVTGADNSVKVDVHNTWWTAAFYGILDFDVKCSDGSTAATDLCTGGSHCLYPSANGASYWWVTGGCSCDRSVCGGSEYCCPNGSPPSQTASCGDRCVDCSGGCN